MARKIAVLVGSLRKDSFTRKVAKVLMQLAPPTLELDFVEIGELPLYNQDLETDNPPPTWTEFRQAMAKFDGVLFATPEYNRSVPGCLKNAIDVGSRPYGHSIWNGKPCGVISVSPGNLGGFGANHHLRQMLVFLNMPAMQMPEAYVGGAAKLFDGDTLVNDDTRKFLQTFIDTFAAWAERHAD